MAESGISGKVAVVTGAGGGIGAAVAWELATRGAVVAAADRDGAALAPVVAGLTAKGHDVVAHTVDVRDSAEVDRFVATVERDMGPIGILANVAGVLRLGAVVDLTDDDWNGVFAVNTHGVFHVSRAVVRRMLPRGDGVVVTVASNAARVPRTRMAAYAASKAATAAFTRCLGLELAGSGIRCNLVSPGSTDTAMLRELWSGADGAAETIQGSPASFRVGIPLRRLATPTDVAEAVVFLASDRAAHITMQDLCVDGGAALGA
jgi:2,3-dihydro-2,3-dihydroxybenzoate dehydrogenase